MADVRVAMVATPDAANFGDVLFPVIADHELGARLGQVAITSYGYRGLASSGWPFPVRPVGALADEIADYDLLLIGGGHLVRDDPVADGYAPSDRRAHPPLGLWLVPALLAHAAGVPVAWNAVGVSDKLSPWLAPLVRVAVTGSAYVAVRNESSAEVLERFAPDARIQVVPDTAFGAAAVVDEEARRAAADQLAAAGIGDRGYVIVQSTNGLSAVREAVDEALGVARERDLAILEVPFGPILGDAPGALDIPGQVATLDAWPGPTVLAALIAGAQAVIHQSLHAGIVGVSVGVPCLRRPMPPGKHDSLNGAPGVHLLGHNGAITALSKPSPRSDPAAEVARRTIRARLDCHWDTVAALAQRRERRPGDELLRFLSRLPGLLEAEAARLAELERSQVACAEYEAGYRAFAARTDELSHALEQARSRIRALEMPDAGQIVASAELEYLRERDATLQRVLDGGWWRVRDRLQPVMALVRASK
jgi:hypothetical protein